MEQVKKVAAEFGGVQFEVLTEQELPWRMCCARGCSFPGAIQMPQPRLRTEDICEWRVLCTRHFLQVVFLIDAFLGSPSPASEARRIADAAGYVGDPARDWRDEIATVFNPSFARCGRCGGGFVVETIGMYAGQRYIHTCGEQKHG